MKNRPHRWIDAFVDPQRTNRSSIPNRGMSSYRCIGTLPASSLKKARLNVRASVDRTDQSIINSRLYDLASIQTNDAAHTNPSNPVPLPFDPPARVFLSPASPAGTPRTLNPRDVRRRRRDRGWFRRSHRHRLRSQTSSSCASSSVSSASRASRTQTLKTYRPWRWF